MGQEGEEIVVRTRRRGRDGGGSVCSVGCVGRGGSSISGSTSSTSSTTTAAIGIGIASSGPNASTSSTTNASTSLTAKTKTTTSNGTTTADKVGDDLHLVLEDHPPDLLLQILLPLLPRLRLPSLPIAARYCPGPAGVPNDVPQSGPAQNQIIDRPAELGRDGLVEGCSHPDVRPDAGDGEDGGAAGTFADAAGRVPKGVGPEGYSWIYFDGLVRVVGGRVGGHGDEAGGTEAGGGRPLGGVVVQFVVAIVGIGVRFWDQTAARQGDELVGRVGLKADGALARRISSSLLPLFVHVIVIIRPCLRLRLYFGRGESTGRIGLPGPAGGLLGGPLLGPRY